VNGAWTVLLVLFALVWFVGAILLMVSAFQESALWGLAVLFIPGAALYFAVTHWERAKVGFLMQVGGGVGSLAALFASLPPPTKLPPPRPYATNAAVSPLDQPDPGVSCPAEDRAHEGFVKWCCTGSAWRETSRGSDCNVVYRPSESCDPGSAGTTSTTVCSTVGGSGKKRR
jgi:hypothetical protein